MRRKLLSDHAFVVAPAVSLSFSSVAIATMANATAANPAEQ